MPTSLTMTASMDECSPIPQSCSSSESVVGKAQGSAGSQCPPPRHCQEEREQGPSESGTSRCRVGLAPGGRGVPFGKSLDALSGCAC